MSSDAPALMDVDELAPLLGYSPRRIRSKIRQGDFPIPAVVLWEGARILFRRIDVEHFLWASSVATPSPPATGPLSGGTRPGGDGIGADGRHRGRAARPTHKSGSPASEAGLPAKRRANRRTGEGTP